MMYLMIYDAKEKNYLFPNKKASFLHRKQIFLSGIGAPETDEELTVKVAGPSKIRFDEPAHFRCHTNLDHVEVTWRLTGNGRSLSHPPSSSRDDLHLKPEMIPNGSQDLLVECMASVPHIGDLVTYTHVVEVLCKCL